MNLSCTLRQIWFYITTDLLKSQYYFAIIGIFMRLVVFDTKITLLARQGKGFYAGMRTSYGSGLRAGSPSGMLR